MGRIGSVVLAAGVWMVCSGEVCGQCGESPSDFCSMARVVSGEVGQHVVVMGVSEATDSGESYCNVNVGHTVWFEVVPEVSGPLTFSTCHPTTTYDTVVQAYRGGESRCEFMNEVDCNDDTFDAECANGCNGAGSRVSFEAVAGERYRFVVGSYNDNSAGCAHCLGVIVTIGEPCGGPPTNDFCQWAQEIPGTPGVHSVTVDVTDATADPFTPSCGVNVGHTTWFQVTPTVSGPMTFSTCERGTTFDTVVQAWTGECQGLMVQMGCNDDTDLPECANGCAGKGSVVSVNGQAGRTYYFQVGSYNSNASGCEPCMSGTLEIVDICARENTPPEAMIADPLFSSCVCGVVPIVGTANDPDGTFREYRLEFLPASGGSWMLIGFGNTPVDGGVLGFWDTQGLPEGYHVLRLTVENSCGMANTAVAVVWVNAEMSTVEMRSPATGSIVGGLVCPDGTVWDHCFHRYQVGYQPAGGMMYLPVDPGQADYHNVVLNDPLAQWNTRNGIANGSYSLRVEGVDSCGHAKVDTHQVEVDNVSPVTEILHPSACAEVEGLVEIHGTVNDQHLGGWVLEYSGGAINGWVPITMGSTPIIGGVLGTWDTARLRPCAYVLRLRAWDQAVLDCNGAIHNSSEYVVTLNVGVCEDFDSDGDGDVDVFDFGAFQNAFTGPG
ncbi:MAG: hypothetical protein AABZ47_02920 [Planctomycetota bacterium]